MPVNGWVLVGLVVAFVIGTLIRGKQIAKLQDDCFRLRRKLRENGLGDPTSALMRDGSVQR